MYLGNLWRPGLATAVAATLALWTGLIVSGGGDAPEPTTATSASSGESAHDGLAIDASAGSPAATPAAQCGGNNQRRFSTLEDLYGLTGDTFQAAVGIINFEKASAADPDPATGYGLGIDDMYIEWREFNLIPDAQECAPQCVNGTNNGTACTDNSACTGGGTCGNGACATLELSTTNTFSGNGIVTISVVETSPSTNNCDNLTAAVPDRQCSPSAPEPGTACVSGVDCNRCDDGTTQCTSDLDCAGVGTPACTALVCVGGANAGNSCTEDAECRTCTGGFSCDEDYGDAGDDFDCGGVNGVDDLIVEVKSEVELNPGEFVLLEKVGTTSEYRGTIPISVSQDAPGVLFIQQAGTDAPTVSATYIDRDDGTGQICKNDVDPLEWGQIESATAVLMDTGRLVVIATPLSDDPTCGTGCDGDPWADTGETLRMNLRVVNKTGQNLTNVRAQMFTNDPKIECVSDSSIIIGSLLDDEEITTSADFFQFKVQDKPGVCDDDSTACLNDAACAAVGPPVCTALVCDGGANDGLACAGDGDCRTCDTTESGDRTTGGTDTNNDSVVDDLDDFSALFTITLSADEIQTTTTPQTVTLDLDLDSTGGSGPTTFTEGFNTASSTDYGKFKASNLDFGLNSLGASDGYRCQYSDPDFVNSNSYGQITDCFVGATPAQADSYFWQVHRTNAIDGGRSYAGTGSLYMGIFGTAADEHTTPMANLEAINTADPINLAVNASPELSFKTQISLMDSRTVNAPIGESADRAVVAVQLAKNSALCSISEAPCTTDTQCPTPGDFCDSGIGPWIKIQPYLNEYDQQGTDNYTNCLFDPIDDGNTEDDFFDPGDQDRRTGPSSTCFPVFSWTHIGDTFNQFSEGALGGASDGPAFNGIGLGSWIEGKFNLDRFRGRRVRVRFLNTALKAGTAVDYEALFLHNPDPGDDGWWIDDVSLENALTTAALISKDDDNPTPVVDCPAAIDCSVTAALTLTPAQTPAPGFPVTLDASGSTATNCVNGNLQYEFSSDVDGLLRPYVHNPVYVDAPIVSKTYSVSARCSTDPSCFAAVAQPAIVDLPGVLATCGNDQLDLGEVCDGIDLAGETCASQGTGNGLLQCDEDCQGFDLSTCHCGDDNIDPGELCDGTDLGGATCESQGFSGGGTLTCLENCTSFGTDNCGGAPGRCLFQTIIADDPNTLSWSADDDVEVVKIDNPRIYSIFATSTENDTSALDISGDLPSSGEAIYYIVKSLDSCPGGGTPIPGWDSGGAGQKFTREELLLDAACNADAPEVWVLNQGMPAGTNPSISIIDSCSETLVTTMPLPTGAPPRGVAFSTLAGAFGDKAYVTQGPNLHVIDTAGRSIDATLTFGVCSNDNTAVCTADINCSPGNCESGNTTLTGIDSARRQTFDGGARSHLYIAANTAEPRYIVVNQATLAVVASDTLNLTPTPAVALDVTVTSRPDPNDPVPDDPARFQSAWFSGRSLGSGELHARLVTTDNSPVWTLRELVSSSPAAPIDNITVGAGRDGELALLPTGSLGTLEDITVAEELCNIGGVQRDVEISGPASGGYRIFALDQQAGRLRVIDEDQIEVQVSPPAICPFTATLATGNDPVAVATIGQEFTQRAFVANRGPRIVTVVRDVFAGPVSDAIIPGLGFNPIDIETQPTNKTACNVENVSSAGSSVSWSITDCEPDTTFFIWCQCHTEPCPPGCPTPPPGPPPGPWPPDRDVGDAPWEPLGIQQNDSTQDKGENGQNANYEVTTNEREPN